MANRNLPPYKPIEVSFLGEQKVAASKRHNYLFVAVRSQIRVYTPKYPYQTIPSSPAYSTLSSTASPRAKGFIDPQEPHAINSITIGELGFEEVLVSAHDDGDVCAWYTRDLRRIAFRLSVGVSAWGVALHKERRLLAVSANTRSIQVFELAIGRHAEDDEEYGSDDNDGLVFGEDSGRRKRRRRTDLQSPGGSGDEDEGDGGSWTDGVGSRRRGKPGSPVKNKTVKTLIGHAQNIPNISFLDDPTGRWLVGTSIDGIVILWDVKTERAVERCRMGYQLAGWSVLFLKPQAFKPVSTLHEALGKPLPPHTPPTAEPPRVSIAAIRTLPTDYYEAPTPLPKALAWDISPPSTSGGGSGRMGLLQLDEGYEDEENEYSEEEEEEEEETDESDGEDAEVEGGVDSGDTDTSGSNNTSPGEVTPLVFMEGDEDSDSGALFGPIRAVELVHDSEGEAGGSGSGGSGVSREKRGRETDKVRENGRRRNAADEDQNDGDEEDNDEEEKPAQPPISLVFSTTQHNCHLLTLTPTLTPTVICRSPLHQTRTSPSLQYLGTIDRLNMVHCIPELSLVVAASQKGRVVIFRLTRVGDIFCMRLDTTLPREDTEGERGRERRPMAALLGVAVGPVQERRRPRGRGGPWGRRRWRLMMVYMDGSVLSYELGREVGVVTVEGVEGGGLGTLGVGGFVMV